MEYTFDSNCVADLYKDAVGFRPGAGWQDKWSRMNDAQRQAEWNQLVNECEASIRREREEAAAATQRWNSHIAQLMAANSITRATALRWDMAAMSAGNDVGYYCFLWGIGYSHEAEILQVLEQ